MKHTLNTSPFRYSDGFGAFLLFAVLVAAVVSLGPVRVHAASIDVSPVIIDWEGERRQEFRETLSLTNETGHAVTLWPIVADIDAESGDLSVPGGPGDGHDRLSTWLEIPRDEIFLKPGATKTVSIKVRSSIHADIGTYHGIIAFPATANFAEAESLIDDAPRVTITVRVLEDRVEQLNIERFTSLKRLFMAFPAALDLRVGNGGNVPMAIKGTVRFFDRNDEQVGSVDLAGDETVEPGDTTHLAIDWSGSGGFGRHKAFVELRYGEGNIVSDSTFFYVVPWWALALFVSCIVLAVAFVTRTLTRVHRHHA